MIWQLSLLLTLPTIPLSIKYICRATCQSRLWRENCGQNFVLETRVEYKVKKGFVSDQEICEVKIRCLLALFPGLPQLQFLIACSMQKQIPGSSFWLVVYKNRLFLYTTIACSMQKQIVLAYYKRSKTGAGEDLGMRLGEIVSKNARSCQLGYLRLFCN